MPAMRREESNAGLVAAGMTELLLNGIIAVEKKKITVVNELPEDLGYLASLYDYLREKVRSTDKMMSDYIASTGSRIRQLTEEIGEALLEKRAVTKDKGGFLGGRIIYIPEKVYKEAIIKILKSAVAIDGNMSPHDMALISILIGTKNLNQYFSDIERKALKAKLKELKKNPDSKQLAEMINSFCKGRKIAVIEDVFTLPKYRGRGIASSLIKKAREQAIAENAETLELCVWNFNTDALHLYEKLGMQVQYYRMEEHLNDRTNSPDLLLNRNKISAVDR